MRRITKLLAALAVAASGAAASAQSLVPTSTYAGLLWSFSASGGSGFAGCTEMLVDATGAVGRSDNYAMYGQLYCPSLGGTYAVDGSAYFNSVGQFNITLDFGVSYKLVCNNLNGGTLSGGCLIYNSAGTQVGTATINFL